MLENDIRNRAIRARDWMLEESFDLWGRVGVHPEIGFHERLDLEGRAISDDTTRVRLQARQVFCFSLAKTLGWKPDMVDELIAHGFDALTMHCQRADGLFGRRMSYTGGLSDETADLYDTAFALLAFSWAARAGHSAAAEATRELSHAIDAHLMRPDEEGGYRETLPASETRLQNPHMHLFESSLAMHESLGDTAPLQRARRIEALLEQRFLQSGTGALREVFAPDWGPAAGDRLEAGHQYEWVWLMGERARLDGQPVSGAADGLYRNAVQLTGPQGEVPLAHELDGTLRDGHERSWGHTEALKAHISRHERGDRDAGARVVSSFDRLWDRHIAASPVPGAWIDRYARHGQPAVTDITAATGYHVYIAFAELMRIAKLS